MNADEIYVGNRLMRDVQPWLALAGCKIPIMARETSIVRMSGSTGKHVRRVLKMARLLTRPTPAATSPARPESAKTASSPRDARDGLIWFIWFV